LASWTILLTYRRCSTWTQNIWMRIKWQKFRKY